MRTLLLVAFLLAVATVAEAQTGFRKIVDDRQRDLAKEVAGYLQKNPDAVDADAAAEWLIKYASQAGQEAEVVPVLETLLKKEGVDRLLVLQGQQVLCLGLAKTDRVQDAVNLFDQHLRFGRPTSAARTLEFTHQLAAQVRMAGDFDSSRAIYRRLSEAFPFNDVIAEIADARLKKLELAGKPAPGLKAPDLSGKEIDLAALSGKVVVVDFWATNCPPCLEEMPRMKSLYKEFKDQGLEILGISLDERQSVAEEYVRGAGITWPIALSRTPAGNLTEKYNAIPIPSVFVVDQKGNVAQVDVYGENLRKTVEKLLAK